MRNLLVLVLCAACGSTPATNSAMPWLRGFTATAVSDVETQAASDHLNVLLGARDDYGALQIAAELAPTEDTETVLASYRRGVIVIDHTGKLVARAPGFDPVGSADDLIALSVGDAGIGAPVIALAVNRGGHRASLTSIILYRVAHGRLEQVFEGAVEDHDGADTFYGAITFVPNGLIYRAPRTPDATAWTFDPNRGRYIVRGPISSPPARVPANDPDLVATPSA